jgi:hypothetical protein
MSSATTVQNWTPRQRVTREVCDFLDTSFENSVSTYNQPNLESTQNQPSFFLSTVLGSVHHLIPIIKHVLDSIYSAVRISPSPFICGIMEHNAALALSRTGGYPAADEDVRVRPTGRARAFHRGLVWCRQSCLFPPLLDVFFVRIY